jgi:hypothetical protein
MLGAIVSVRVTGRLSPAEFLATRITAKVPDARGVPEMAPVNALKLRPLGSPDTK